MHDVHEVHDVHAVKIPPGISTESMPVLSDIDQLTFQYMVNCGHAPRAQSFETDEYKTEMTFYQKRLLKYIEGCIFRDCEGDEVEEGTPENISPDNIQLYRQLMKGLIEDFKMIDACDMYQSEYEERGPPDEARPDESQPTASPTPTPNDELANKTLFLHPMRTKRARNCIDEFVCVKQSPVEMPPPPQKQPTIRAIDLRKDELRIGRRIVEQKTIQSQCSDEPIKEPEDVKKIKRIKKVKKVSKATTGSPKKNAEKVKKFKIRRGKIDHDEPNNET